MHQPPPDPPRPPVQTARQPTKFAIPPPAGIRRPLFPDIAIGAYNQDGSSNQGQMQLEYGRNGGDISQAQPVHRSYSEAGPSQFAATATEEHVYLYPGSYQGVDQGMGFTTFG
jgi:hypothetical protein